MISGLSETNILHEQNVDAIFVHEHGHHESNDCDKNIKKLQLNKICAFEGAHEENLALLAGAHIRGGV